MSKPPRRRITLSDVNRELCDPALTGVSHEFRRAYVLLVRSLEDVKPWSGDN